MPIAPLGRDTMRRTGDARTNRTAGHPATPYPVPSMRATVAVLGLPLALVLTIVAPTAMFAAALTAGLGYVVVWLFRPRVAEAGISLPGSGARVRINSKRDCEAQTCEFAIRVAIVAESS